MLTPILLLLFAPLIKAIEPITTAIISGSVLSAGVVYQFWDDQIKCQFTECCSTPYWIPLNVSKFQHDFDTHVYGQHIAKKIVAKALRSHALKAKRKKALVLSFHGWTGTGKNYVARFIAESIFRQGAKSQYVKTFIATVDFPDPAKVDVYFISLQKQIMETVQKCSKSMFIFDEIDKLPRGLVDAIKPFIDYHDEVLGIDFRETIFVFLSNTGGKLINDLTFQAWQEGRSRESIEYNELKSLIENGAFNEIGGLHQSSVIDKHLVDWFVPFLPLERKHVVSCIITAVHEQNSTIVPTNQEIESILDELIYFPSDYSVYSTTGCKTIHPKVDLLIDDILQRNEL